MNAHLCALTWKNRDLKMEETRNNRTLMMNQNLSATKNIICLQKRVHSFNFQSPSPITLMVRIMIYFLSVPSFRNFLPFRNITTSIQLYPCPYPMVFPSPSSHCYNLAEETSTAPKPPRHLGMPKARDPEKHHVLARTRRKPP